MSDRGPLKTPTLADAFSRSDSKPEEVKASGKRTKAEMLELRKKMMNYDPRAQASKSKTSNKKKPARQASPELEKKVAEVQVLKKSSAKKVEIPLSKSQEKKVY